MIKKVFASLCKYLGLIVLTVTSIGILSQPMTAQSTDSSQDDQFESLRSDVGIHGLTANVHWLSDLKYLKNDTLQYDGSSELEFVYRNVRMMSQRLGVGYQILTSFFVNGNDTDFGVGSWGAGPVVRAYPFRTDRFQPYVQANALMGNNLALSELANTQTGGNGFRVRLGIRGGFAFRITNSVGLFGEVGYDWESSRIFKADARALQANVGIDFYLFN